PARAATRSPGSGWTTPASARTRNQTNSRHSYQISPRLSGALHTSSSSQRWCTWRSRATRRTCAPPPTSR
ncbi:unnamed protein product, partial [Heterosigma akashiwo]